MFPFCSLPLICRPLFSVLIFIISGKSLAKAKGDARNQQEEKTMMMKKLAQKIIVQPFFFSHSFSLSPFWFVVYLSITSLLTMGVPKIEPKSLYWNMCALCDRCEIREEKRRSYTEYPEFMLHPFFPGTFLHLFRACYFWCEWSKQEILKFCSPLFFINTLFWWWVRDRGNDFARHRWYLEIK